MQKSKEDYLEMLQRASGKLSGFSLAPLKEGTGDRTRLFFRVKTTDGIESESSLEMMQVEGNWKPVIGMGWRYPKEASVPTHRNRVCSEICAGISWRGGCRLRTFGSGNP